MRAVAAVVWIPKDPGNRGSEAPNPLDHREKMGSSSGEGGQGYSLSLEGRKSGGHPDLISHSHCPACHSPRPLCHPGH